MDIIDVSESADDYLAFFTPTRHVYVPGLLMHIGGVIDYHHGGASLAFGFKD